GRGWVRKDVGHDAMANQLRHDFGGVADQTDRQRLFLALRSQNEVESLFQVTGHALEVAGLKAALDACRVDVDAEESSAVHSSGQRLGAAHAAQAGADHETAGQWVFTSTSGFGKMLSTTSGEGFIGPLQNALGADVDPASGRHLAVHGQAHLLQESEFLPRGPARYEQAVSNEDSRGHFMCADHSNG